MPRKTAKVKRNPYLSEAQACLFRAAKYGSWGKDLTKREINSIMALRQRVIALQDRIVKRKQGKRRKVTQ